MTKRKRSEHGQSLVELAVTLPILILILLGTLDVGMGIFSYSMLRDAAQEGAFYGSFNPANKATSANTSLMKSCTFPRSNEVYVQPNSNCAENKHAVPCASCFDEFYVGNGNAL